MAPGKNRKRCADSDGYTYVPKKKRKVSPNFEEESIRISAPQREPERYASSNDFHNLFNEGKVAPKCNTLLSVSYAQTQIISSYEANADHSSCESHSISYERKLPAALNEVLIAYKIHEIINNLSKFKKSASSVNYSNNSKVVASPQSLHSQSNPEVYEWDFHKVVAPPIGINEDLAEKKLFEVILDLIKLKMRSGVTDLEADGVKHILHHIVDEYANANESDGTIDDNMDDKPGCSRWFHPK
ncbi:uncharacterized protein LOC119687082 [Teleopsis dalmanni]|uniref:uncharacterized protein LOC119687082 n=1 Tax=Teleopsis dalmanni TaxID=139649 RepID=UPI0018CD72E2|nr:uncharacterized protein LOC119687082 [Teleopsis dalmanni]